MDDLDLKDKQKEASEAKMIDDAFQHLLNTYLATRHRKKVDIITKAFNFARQAHKGVRRLSGEPYIMHPIAVAQIACEEMGLGSTSICSALLHDVVEDTDYTVEDIENIFGSRELQETASDNEQRHKGDSDKDLRPSAQHAYPCQPTGKQAIQDCGRDSLHIRTAGKPSRTEQDKNRA